MSKSVTCPRCKNPITVDTPPSPEGIQVQCGSCNATFRLKSKSASSKPPEPTKDAGLVSQPFDLPNLDAPNDDELRLASLAKPLSNPKPNSGSKTASKKPEASPAFNPLQSPLSPLSPLQPRTPGGLWGVKHPGGSNSKSQNAEIKSKHPVALIIAVCAVGAFLILGTIAGLVFILNRGNDKSANAQNNGNADGNKSIRENVRDSIVERGRNFAEKLDELTGETPPVANAGGQAPPNGDAANSLDNPPLDTDQPFFGPVNRQNSPVVFNQPIPGVVARAKTDYEIRQDDRLIQFVEVKHATKIAISENEKDGGDTDTLAKPELGNENSRLWQTEPDPLPAESASAIATELNISLANIESDKGNIDKSIQPGNGNHEVFPPAFRTNHILASLNGPYLIAPPMPEKSPFGWKVTSRDNRWTKIEPIEQPLDDISVLDLRTGQPAGTFSSRIHTSRLIALSPDGMTLVTACHELLPPERFDNWVPPTEKEKEERLEKSRSLFVWERDAKKKKPRQLKMNGQVRSATFCDNNQLALLVEGDEQSIELWDTQSGKLIRTIKIGPLLKYSSPYFVPADPLNLNQNPPRLPGLLAISPTGKYVAVLTPAGIAMAKVSDGSILGMLPMTGATRLFYKAYEQNRWDEVDAQPGGKGNFNGKADDCLGLEFLPDGNRLMVVFSSNDNETYPQMRMLQFDIRTGTQVFEKNWGKPAKGPALLAPGEKFLLLSAWDDSPYITLLKPCSYEVDKHEGDYDADLPLVLRYPATGPLLCYKKELGNPSPEGNRIYTLPRETFDADLGGNSELNDHGLAKRPPAIAANRSNMKLFKPEPPGQWQPVPAIEVSGATTTATRYASIAWPVAMARSKALVIDTDTLNRSKDPVMARLIDLTSATGEATKPFELLSYSITQGSTYDRTNDGSQLIPAAIAQDGTRFAIGDPDRKGHAEVWTTVPERLVCFKSDQSKADWLDWAGFTNDRALLTLEAGVLSCWQYAQDQVTGTYALDGGYHLPAVFSPDRKLLAIASNKSLDIIEVSTGKCVNRLSLAGLFPSDVAFSPDCKHLAVAYAGSRENVSQLQLQMSSLGGAGVQSHWANATAIWDLGTGSVRLNENAKVQQVTWATPEHLLICAPKPQVFDLKLNMHTFTSDSGGWRDSDGDLWACPSNDEKEKKWYKLSLTDRPSPDEEPFLADNRSFFDPKSVPVQFELDLGSKADAEKFGPAIVRTIQQEGWTVGPSKFVIRMIPRAQNSNEEIEFLSGHRIRVPHVVYSIRLRDGNGRVISQAQTVGGFSQTSSKYRTKVDLETRRITGDNALDFGSKAPSTAILEEIFETGNGLAFPGLPDQPVLVTGGGNLPIPAEVKSSASSR